VGTVEAGKLARVGGVDLTIKDGIVYDARALRADVRRMVAEDKSARSINVLPQPGSG
jgi:pyruvate/2-oxoglutarate dehydrogenase complex dihydrolipoamide acyltransferase (E2) component